MSLKVFSCRSTFHTRYTEGCYYYQTYYGLFLQIFLTLFLNLKVNEIINDSLLLMVESDVVVVRLASDVSLPGVVPLLPGLPVLVPVPVEVSSGPTVATLSTYVAPDVPM